MGARDSRSLRGLAGREEGEIIAIDSAWSDSREPAPVGGDAIDDRVEAGRIVDRHLRQRLAIQLDLGQVQAVDELAIAHVALAAGGVQPDDPQLAELTLAHAAIAE